MITHKFTSKTLNAFINFVMTPEMAIELQELNVFKFNPRFPTSTAVGRIASSILADTYESETANTVAFDKDGYCIDGMTRILAIIKANKPAILHIFVGCKRNAYTNAGRPATKGQRWAQLEGKSREESKKMNRLLGITSAWIRSVKGVNYHPDLEEEIGFYYQHKAAIDFVEPIGKNPHSKSVGVRAAFARYYSKYPIQAKKLLEQVKNNAEGLLPTSPAAVLVKWLNENVHGGGRRANDIRFQAAAGVIHGNQKTIFVGSWNI